MKKLLSISLLLSALLSFSSCSESDDETEEYPEWQTKNESYWTSLYSSTLARKAAGDTAVDTIRKWSLQNQKPYYANSTVSYSATDYIIVEKKQAGTGTELPQYSDSVGIYYQGHLIPSTTYTGGYIFDSSVGWNDAYNTALMKPSVLNVSDVVDGFATALLQMHEGDRWTVYIPYQLGYGSTEQSAIPAYSTLIFDLTLAKIYPTGRK